MRQSEAMNFGWFAADVGSELQASGVATRDIAPEWLKMRLLKEWLERTNYATPKMVATFIARDWKEIQKKVEDDA